MFSISPASTSNLMGLLFSPYDDSASADPIVVEKLLKEGKGEEALTEALKGHSFFPPGNNEILEKIAVFHLERGEFSQAKKAAGYIFSTSLNGIYEKIFEAELAKDDLIGAEETAGSIVGAECYDKALTQIFDKRIEKKDFYGAFLTALKTGFLTINSLLQKLFNICMENREYGIAKQAVEKMSHRNQEHEAGLKTILDAELEKKDFKAAIKTYTMLSTQESAQKIADCLQQSNLTLEELNNIEKAFWSRSLIPAFYSNLDLTILRALKSVYTSLNNAEGVARLDNNIKLIEKSDQKIKEWNDFGNRMDEKIRALIPIAFISAAASGIALVLGGDPKQLTDTFPMITAAGVVGILASDDVKIYRPENFLGVGAGLAASSSGMSPLSSVAIGLGTALVTRVPVIQSVAEKTLHFGSNAIWQTGKLAVYAVDRAFETGIDLTGRLVDGGFKLVDKTFTLLGSSVSTLDAVLDKIACR